MQFVYIVSSEYVWQIAVLVAGVLTGVVIVGLASEGLSIRMHLSGRTYASSTSRAATVFHATSMPSKYNPVLSRLPKISSSSKAISMACDWGEAVLHMVILPHLLRFLRIAPWSLRPRPKLPRCNALQLKDFNHSNEQHAQPLRE